MIVTTKKLFEHAYGNYAIGAYNINNLEQTMGLFRGCSAYLAASQTVYANGFPLDDAWIHQTYARSLGWQGEWAYLPGQPSAGSTSPLWTALLAAGYAMRLPYLAWAYLLGALSLLAVAWTGEELLRSYLPGYASGVPWAGIFLAGEWHLAWSSVSGMETLLNAALILLALGLIGRARGRVWGWVGLLAGLGAWIRPDAVTLLGPAVFVLVLDERGWKQRFSGLAWLLGGMAAFFIPYLLFNLTVQGSIWPNTFYAKQAEYEILRAQPFLLRYWSLLRLPLIGSGLFLLPGFILILWESWKARRWAILAGGIWFAGYALLYALRLPVAYQYGRYLMPAMPVFFVIGLAGSVALMTKLRATRTGWLLARVGLLSAGITWLAFCIIGGGRYAQDVAIIETEMVIPARWIQENTAPGALVAAHDIGAAGYFSKRTLVDLAGLISPEVIPFIRNEEQLSRYLDQRGVDYLIVLEGWYERLPQGKEVVFRSEESFAPASGGNNMMIYRWK